MAHNINSYIGRQSAWHGLGTVTGNYLSWQDILAAGHLTYDVVKQQLHDPTGNPVNAWGTFRTDTNQFLGVVGANYQILSHKQGFEVMDALVSSISGAHYETAGSLGNGEVVWGLVDLSQTIRVLGEDEHKSYLLMKSSYDGTCAHSYGKTDVRVVCQNTLNLALSNAVASKLKIKHTKNGAQKLVDAKDVLLSIQAENKTLEERLNFLAERKLTRESMTSILDRIFPKSKKEVVDGQEVALSSTKRDNILAEVLALYESNDNNMFPSQRGTAYNLLNAVTEYTDHARSANNGITGRQLSAAVGSGDALKTTAFEVILETANHLPLANEPKIYSYQQSIPSSSTSLLDSVLEMGISGSSN